MQGRGSQSSSELAADRTPSNEGSTFGHGPDHPGSAHPSAKFQRTKATINGKSAAMEVCHMEPGKGYAHSGPGKGAVEPAECLRGRAHAETHGDKRRSRSTLPRPKEDDGGGKQRSQRIHAYLVPRFPGETRMHQGLDGAHRQRGDASHRSPDPPGAEPPQTCKRRWRR